MPRRKYKWYLVLLNDWAYHIVNQNQLRAWEHTKTQYRVIKQVPSDFTTTVEELEKMSRAYRKVSGKSESWWHEVAYHDE